MKKVKIIRDTVVSKDKHAKKGSTISVDNDTARNLITAGAAVADIESDVAEDGEDTSTAAKTKK